MRLMVDWVTGIIQPNTADLVGFRPWEKLDHRFDTGRVLKVTPDGDVEWESAARVTVPGSHEHNITVRSPDGFRLELSGNPVKYRQGHNLYGSDDALGLFLGAGQHVLKHAGDQSWFPTPETWRALQLEGPRFNRIDVTRSYRFPTLAASRAWLRDVASQGRSRHGGTISREGTVYFGKNSSRWSFKMYGKWDELQAAGDTHRLSSLLPPGARRKLEEWACGVVRFELTLRTKELAKWADLTPKGLQTIWPHYYERIELNENARAHEMMTQELDNAAQGYLARWQAGQDLRQTLPDSTFRKWRRRLLDAVGVDIAGKPVAAAAVDPVQMQLDPLGWDPEPLDYRFYEPAESLKRMYQEH